MMGFLRRNKLFTLLVISTFIGFLMSLTDPRWDTVLTALFALLVIWWPVKWFFRIIRRIPWGRKTPWEKNEEDREAWAWRDWLFILQEEKQKEEENRHD
jgi:Ca2+/Na+ antiporter